MSKLTNTGKLAVGFGAMVLMPFLVLYNAFAWGVVFMKYYYWFIFPVFGELPTLTLTNFIGIGAVITGIMAIPIYPTIKKEFRSNNDDWAFPFIKPWIFLFFAWFIHLFIN